MKDQAKLQIEKEVEINLQEKSQTKNQQKIG
jgi:hypothetical protein